jgi:hemoglobin
MIDIRNREDIVLLLEKFYSKALSDATIGYFFTEVVPLNMETHIPLITDFWETVLFGKAAYKGNVMKMHQHIHELSPFNDEHFKRWAQLFIETVDEMYEGDIATTAKQRAESVATLMRIKLLHGGIGFSGKQ